jgi:hypothetical protein
MTPEEIIEGNKLIAEFLVSTGQNGVSLWTGIDHTSYHSSWDWLHPVYRNVAEIGMWMITNGHDKLWLEKSKEIDNAMLTGETPEMASILISQLIKWFNSQQS